MKKENAIDHKTSLTGLEIAVIGYAGRFNNCQNVEEYWKILSQGRETFHTYSDDELRALGIKDEVFNDENYVKIKGILSEKECFDNGLFGYTPNEAKVMDPQIRVLHEVVWESLEMAGYTPNKTKKKIGLYASASNNSIWQSIMRLDNTNKLNAFATGYLADRDFMCSLISYNLNLKGPAIFSHSACSSSLLAVHQAARALQTGDCHIAVAGGVSTSLVEEGGYKYQENLIFSPDGHCRAFDTEANGTVKGEGGGVVVLKRYRDAIQDNDTIYAILKSSAVNNDGNDKIGYSAPSVSGQKQVISNSVKLAKIDPDTISYVEAHGTGTKLGDPVEINALREAYGQDPRLHTAIGSVKTNLGHLDTAAGIASFIKVLLMLKHKKIPASLHFKKSNTLIDFENSSFYVNNKLQEWKSEHEKLRAGISSFGIGGTNCHIILEEAPKIAEEVSEIAPYPINLSAKSEDKLKEISENLATYLNQNPSLNIADISFTLNTGRADLEIRRSLSAQSIDELIPKLKGHSDVATRVTKTERKPVFVFSGQGSQYVNMGKTLYERFPFFKSQLDSCFLLFQKHYNILLKDHLFPENSKDSDQIHETLYAQLGLFSISYALSKFLIAMGITPAALIGHSIGEYAAAVISGVLNLEDAIKIVGKRALLMQGAARGKMYAVFGKERNIAEYLPEEIAIAAVNMDNLVIISGDSSKIAECIEDLKSIDIPSKLLNTSHAFHSPMMEEILEPYASFLEGFTFQKPTIPIISNLTGKFLEKTPDSNYWRDHLRNTVRYNDGVTTLLNAGYNDFIEVGPGNQLIKLIERIATQKEELQLFNLLAQPGKDTNLHSNYFLNAISQLWKAGLPVDWQIIYKDHANRKVPLPSYPFEKTPFPSPLTLSQLLARLGGSKSHEGHTGESDWLYQPFWKATAISASSSPYAFEGKTAIVFANQGGHAHHLIGQINKIKGVKIIEINTGNDFCKISPQQYTINIKETRDYDMLFAEIRKDNYTKIDNVIHCFGLDNLSSSDSIENLELALNTGYLSLTFLAKSLLSNGYAEDIHFQVLTKQVTKIDEQQALEPLKATYLGALKIISVEYDNLSCRLINLAPEFPKERDILSIITDELSVQEEEIIVSYHKENRYVPGFKKTIPSSSAKRALREGGCYLIPGGLGGMGLAIAGDIAKNERAKIALLTRRSFPSTDQWEKDLVDLAPEETEVIRRIEKMKKHGAEIVIVTADVADAGKMKEVISDIQERFGKINGIIWAAGVIDYDGVIQRRTREEFITNITSKVHGLLILESLLYFEELDFISLFSSIGNVFYKGKFGQVAYNVANEFLDAFAQGYRKNNNVFTINWCDWQQVGMTVRALEEGKGKLSGTEIETLLKDGLSPEEGVEVFRRCLKNPSTNFVVHKSDLIEAIKTENEEITNSNAESAEEIIYKRPQLNSPYKEPTNSLEEQLVSMCCALFGIDKVGVDDDFLELGGDSLSAIQFINQIKKEMGVKISLEEFFTNPTMKSLAATINIRQDYSQVKVSPKKEEQPEIIKYPLLPSQKRMLILHRLFPQQTNYNQTFIFKTPGLSVEKLRVTLDTLLKRHQVLQASFEIASETPQLEIKSKVDFDIETYNIENDAEFDTVVRKFQRPFDLSHAPLFRVGIVKNAGGADYLISDIHHIISDGRSNQIFLNDLMRLLNDEPLEKVEASFTSYIEYFYSEEVQRELVDAERYWLERFDGFVQKRGLVLDRERDPEDSRAGANYRFRISEGLSKAVVREAQKAKTTVFAYNLAAFYILLSKLCDDTDLVIGTTLLGRNLASFDNVMGMFIETVALRNNVDSGQAFETFLDQVKNNIYKDFDHREYPFENLVDKLNLPKNRSRNPLFDIVFSSDDISNKSSNRQNTSTAEFEQVAYNNNQVSFDILFTFKMEEDILSFNFQYNSNLFNKETIEHYAALYGTILEQITSVRTIQISEIPLFPDVSGKLLLKEASAVAKNGTLAEEEHVYRKFELMAEQFKSSNALIYDNQQVTYGDLIRKVNKLSHYLQTECDIKPGDRIGIYGARSSDLVTAILAIIKTRAVFVPVDISFPEERVKYIFSKSEVKLVLTDTESMFNIPYFDKTIFAMDVQMETLEELPYVRFEGSLEDSAYILFTSGSTGEPKGVRIGHRSLANHIAWGNRFFFENSCDYNMPLFTSISFDFTLNSIFCPLNRGASVHIYHDSKGIDQSLKNILLSDIRAIKVTPSHIDMLASFKIDKTAIEKVILGGEELLPHHVTLLKKMNKDIVVFNEYGPTEATIACTAKEIVSLDEKITIGSPIDNTAILILDEKLRPLPAHVPGEIYISGVCLAEGYMSQEITAEKFIPMPGAPEIRIYKTGDKGLYTPNGEIVFLGRIQENEQVKVRGYRIELQEIESIFSKIDGVNRVVVVIKELNDEPTVVAYYSSKIPIEERQIKSYLQKFLPQQMIPGQIIQVQELPLTINGKVNYKALPDPEGTRKKSYVPPINELEIQLVSLWEDILNLEKDTIGINDGFFSLGGNSLKVVQLSQRIEDDFGITIPVAELFDFDTIQLIIENFFKELPANNGEKIDDLHDTSLDLLNKINM